MGSEVKGLRSHRITRKALTKGLGTWMIDTDRQGDCTLSHPTPAWFSDLYIGLPAAHSSHLTVPLVLSSLNHLTQQVFTVRLLTHHREPYSALSILTTFQQQFLNR
jgi:hypothetical protein